MQVEWSPEDAREHLRQTDLYTQINSKSHVFSNTEMRVVLHCHAVVLAATQATLQRLQARIAELEAMLATSEETRMALVESVEHLLPEVAQ